MYLHRTGIDQRARKTGKIRVPTSLDDKMKRLATEEHLSLSAVIRQTVQQHAAAHRRPS